MLAEGIEQLGELDAVVGLGVPMAQGYLLGRPGAAVGRRRQPRAPRLLRRPGPHPGQAQPPLAARARPATAYDVPTSAFRGGRRRHRPGGDARRPGRARSPPSTRTGWCTPRCTRGCGSASTPRWPRPPSGRSPGPTRQRFHPLLCVDDARPATSAWSAWSACVTYLTAPHRAPRLSSAFSAATQTGLAQWDRDHRTRAVEPRASWSSTTTAPCASRCAARWSSTGTTSAWPATGPRRWPASPGSARRAGHRRDDAAARRHRDHPGAAHRRQRPADPGAHRPRLGRRPGRGPRRRRRRLPHQAVRARGAARPAPRAAAPGAAPRPTATASTTRCSPSPT